MKKNLFRLAKVLLLLYCVIGIIFYYAQDKLMLHPKPVAQSVRYELGAPYKELNIPYDKESTINIVQLNPDSLAPGVMLYFHGGKENLAHYAPAARSLSKDREEVWLIDYPGFGKSTGPFAEKKVYDYALLLYKLARVRWKPQQITLYGQGLGAPVAAQLASVRDCKQLILEQPYGGLDSLAHHYLPVYPVRRMLHYHFPTDQFLPSVTAPISFLNESNLTEGIK